MQQPQIIQKQEFTVVGFETPFIHALSPDTNNFKVIGPLWGRILQHADGIPHRIGQDMFGIIYGRPENERSHPHELQYIAGVAVSATTNIPDGMVAHTVAGGEYAVFLHRGPIDKIGDTVGEVYRTWLPQSPYQHAGIVDVELYDERFQPDGEDSIMEYWISIKPKA